MNLENLWDPIYLDAPLCDAPFHYANLRNSPHLIQLCEQVLALSPRGSRVLEAGCGTGYCSIWLSRRGIQAEGIDLSPRIVERARIANNMLGGRAEFRVGDLLSLYGGASQQGGRYQTIFSQGVLEHHTAPEIRYIVAQQLALAEWVVASVPSFYYADSEMGDERRLTLEHWQDLLSDFGDRAQMCYYGHPAAGERDHVLMVLRGGAPEELSGLLDGPQPFRPGITLIVHTRNEAHNLAGCIESARDIADQIVVCDMESTDGTVEIARQLGAEVVCVPQTGEVDATRNVSALYATCSWVLFLDADERLGQRLGPHLRSRTEALPDEFAGAYPGFLHMFCGKPLQCLRPGYTAPRLLRNGRFHFRARLHGGVVADGQLERIPADDPQMCILHHSYPDLASHVEKRNRYTTTEAARDLREGRRYRWQGLADEMGAALVSSYDQGGAARDGQRGLFWSLFSMNYELERQAKLWELRDRAGLAAADEQQPPPTAREFVERMLAAVGGRDRPALPPIRLAQEGGARVVWSGPLLDPSGYGEESRSFLMALDEAAVPAAGHVLGWNLDAPISEIERSRLSPLLARDAAPGFALVVQDFASSFVRHPEAGLCIGRTMFETDRLPAAWAEGCNRMDFVWVPSEFNRLTFAASGVAREKLVVVPGCIQPAAYRRPEEAPAAVRAHVADGQFVFLSVFDWSLHKGWDVLLSGFLQEFEATEGARLLLKVWSTLGYAPEQIRDQAVTQVRDSLGIDLAADARVLFVFDRFSAAQMVGLYQAADAFVLPSRGEGWGRPYMEAMACGRPVIGTNWGGATAFMTAENSYLVDCEPEPVPERGWREVPQYQGHRWAEPNVASLRQAMRRVFTEQSEAATVGGRACEEVGRRFSRKAVGALMRTELERVGAL